MIKFFTCIGIAVSVIGTVFTLWTVLNTSIKKAGTYNELAERNEVFPKEKRITIIGCALIVIGGIMQIIGCAIS